MNVVVEAERILQKYRELSMFTSVDSHTEVSIFCDSGAKVHMVTPSKKISGTSVRSIEDVRLGIRGNCRLCQWERYHYT